MKCYVLFVSFMISLIHDVYLFYMRLCVGYIQASRALMIAAIVFGTFGLVATLVGMQCSKFGGENYVLKGRIAAVGGVCFLLQGKDKSKLYLQKTNYQ